MPTRLRIRYLHRSLRQPRMASHSARCLFPCYSRAAFDVPEPQGCYAFVCDGPRGCSAVDTHGARFGLTLLFDLNGFDPVSCVSGGSSSYRYVAILADSG